MDGVCDALCMLVGISFPDVAAHGLPYVTMVFAFITFTGALKSEFKDVLRVFHDPKPLLCMLVMIHVVIPAVACGAGHLFFGSDLMRSQVWYWNFPYRQRW